VAAVLLTLACVIGGLMASGHLPSFTNILDKYRAETTEPETVSAPVRITEKAARPETLRGTKIYVSSDGGAMSLIDGIAESGFNCVVFEESRESGGFGLTAIAQFPENLKALVEYAKSKGLYTVVRAESIADYYAVSVPVSYTQVFDGITLQVPFDALIISDVYNSARANAAQVAEIVADTRKFLYDHSTVGEVIAALPAGALTAAGDEISQSVMDAISGEIIDSVYIEPGANDGENIFMKWKEFAAEKNCGLVIAQSESLIAQENGYNRVEKVLKQLSGIYKADGERGISTVTCAFSDLAADAEGLSFIKSSLSQGGSPDSYLKTFKISNHSSKEFTTNESKISFTGECNPLYPLTCNKEEVKYTDEGDFSLEFDLAEGKNVFAFEHRGETYTYTVTYKIDLIKSITPSGKLTTPGGSIIEIRVTAHRKAAVYATVNQQRVTLQNSNVVIDSNEDRSMDADSDFATFVGKYTLPKNTSSSSVNIGTIKAYASYNGSAASITGASVSVTPTETVTALPVVVPTMPPTTTTATTTTSGPTTNMFYSPPTSATESSTDNGPSDSETEPTTAEPLYLPPQYTPYRDNGVAGTARMCVIKTDYAEALPLSPLNDLSVPLSTPLLAGTFDFIVGESSFDTFTYYNLASGRRVYRDEVTVIDRAFALPANTVTAISSGTSGGATYMNLYCSWKIPFNAVLNGQTYIKDPKNGREHAVTSMNASSLDITFYYTVSLVGSINISGSSVIKSYDWITNTAAQTCTLRLYLKSGSKFYGYHVKYNSDGSLHLSIKEPGSPSIAGHKIMLDPGHGGKDVGAPCAANSASYNEAKLNLQIAERLKQKLEAAGAVVLMTRTANTDVTMAERKLMTRRNNPDLYISVHCDAATSSAGYGTSAYYYRPYSYQLAKPIHDNLVSVYRNTIYKQNLPNIARGTMYFPYNVIRIEECPAVLIEFGYVSNIDECKALQNPAYQDALADGAVRGISEYFAATR